MYHLVVEQVAKYDKDTKMSRKNVRRLERQPTSSEALANEMGQTTFFFKFFASLFKWYPLSLFFRILEEKAPERVMHVQSN